MFIRLTFVIVGLSGARAADSPPPNPDDGREVLRTTALAPAMYVGLLYFFDDPRPATDRPGTKGRIRNWLAKDRRWPVNPFDCLTKLNARVDVRHERRVLTNDELTRLIQAAEQRDKTFGLIYRLAAMTGLRASELASLTSAAFDLDVLFCFKSSGTNFAGFTETLVFFGELRVCLCPARNRLSGQQDR